MAKRAAKRAVSSADDLKVMELVQKSGILNKSATLDQVMALSLTLGESGLGGATAAARWWIVSRHYVICGDQRT